MTLRVHEDAATPSARRALEAMRGIPLLREFYLAGGTALALRLGHRVSVDLDFFSGTNALGLPEREALKAGLRGNRSFRVQEEKDGTMHLILEGAAVSLFRYGYPLLGPTSPWKGVALASVEDIGLMKLGAIAGRGARKDFLDLYAICRRIPLERLLRRVNEKFTDSRDFLPQAAKALVYFDDADKDPMPELLAPVRWPQVKAFFEHEAPRAFSRLLGRPK